MRVYEKPVCRTSVKDVFAKYKVFITEKFLEEFGRSFETVAGSMYSWMSSYDYNPRAEEMIVLQTRTFIRSQNLDASVLKNAEFMRNLTNRMANYLSVYTIKSGRYKTLADAKEAMLAKLYYEFSYIQNYQADMKKHLRRKKEIQAYHELNQMKRDIARGIWAQETQRIKR